ncbi:hypothetical protein M569_05616 [Genlisea aurea]|uniref:Uncharacterized protein n=1 Tax=Genlisea aurea TaxID=192259 RepID=S8E0F8_9LAMI|nr:hypothetical protein M569_05616 [Genlisea aurea]
MSDFKVFSTQSIDLNAIRSRVAELRRVPESLKFAPHKDEKNLKAITDEFEKNMEVSFSDWSSYLSTLSSEDLDEALSQLKQVLGELENENSAMANDTNELKLSCTKENEKLEEELEKLCSSLEFAEGQFLMPSN